MVRGTNRYIVQVILLAFLVEGGSRKWRSQLQCSRDSNSIVPADRNSCMHVYALTSTSDYHNIAILKMLVDTINKYERGLR
jgi:hypothetical protein